MGVVTVKISRAAESWWFQFSLEYLFFFFILDFTSWIPEFPGSPAPNSGVPYFYFFCSYLTQQLWSTIKIGIFHSPLNPESSHSVSCIHCPRSLSLRILTFLGSQENSRGAEFSAFDPSPAWWGSNILAIFPVKTQMIWVTLAFFLTTWAVTSESSLLLGSIQEGKKIRTKQSFVYFVCQKILVQVFLLCLACIGFFFFKSFPKENSSPKTSYHLLTTCYVSGPGRGAGSMLSLNLLNKYRRHAPMPSFYG